MYNPVDDIIPRKLEPEVEELMNKLNIIISKFVDFGSNILKWDTEVERPEAYNLPIIMSYRHFLELVDAISILVTHSSVDPCKPLLRSILETYFSLAYMLETNVANRGMSFLVWHIHKQIKAHMRNDSTSEMGKQLRRKLSSDKLTGNLILPDDPQSSAKIAALEATLQEPAYQQAEQEYQRLRLSNERNPPWYRFYDGPKNIEEMANHLNLMALYDIVYRRWSGPTHGTDVIIRKASVSADGSADIFQLRYFGNVQEVAQWTLSLSLKMFKLYIDDRLPAKTDDYTAWYLTIREPFFRISSKEPLIVAS